MKAERIEIIRHKTEDTEGYLVNLVCFTESGNLEDLTFANLHASGNAVILAHKISRMLSTDNKPVRVSANYSDSWIKG